MTEYLDKTVHMCGKELDVYYRKTIEAEEHTTLSGDPGTPEYIDVEILDVQCNGIPYYDVLIRASQLFKFSFTSELEKDL